MKHTSNIIADNSSKEVNEILEMEGTINEVNAILKDVNSLNEIIPFLYVKDNVLIDLQNFSVTSVTPVNQLM